jgi:formylglycine-generating enzyme required for sulfatase activity
MRFRGIILAGWMMLAFAAVPPRPAETAEPAGDPAPLTAAQERALQAKDTFRECANCPEMVVVPAGRFTMGSPKGEKDRRDHEGPQHVVTFARPFAVGRLHVTVDQFAAFVRKTGYEASSTCGTWYPSDSRTDYSWRRPGFTQEGAHPVVCVSWDDAKAYADWIAQETGKPYRLLSEAEFEYAARGRTSPGAYPRFWFGNDERDLCRYGNAANRKMRDSVAMAKNWRVAPCDDGYADTSPAGRYAPNAFGLYDMAGNAWQWTADCWHDSYQGAPSDGSAWTAGACKNGHVIRGGSSGTLAEELRAANRIPYTVANVEGGFRVARTIMP